MAVKSSSNQSMSSNHVSRAEVQASAYVVSAATGELKGMHFSTGGERGGGFEVSSEHPTPPTSPRRAAIASSPTSPTSKTPLSPTHKLRRTGSADSTGSRSSRHGAAAAHTITEECERLFCGTLVAAFLGEGRVADQDPLGMGALSISTPLSPPDSVMTGRAGLGRKLVDFRKDSGLASGAVPTPPSSLTSSASEALEVGAEVEEPGMVSEYVEVWTYTSGLRFRGFVAGGEEDRALFVFFDREVVGKDLKKGLMALLELASTPTFDCNKLIACLDRGAENQGDLDDMIHDLGWVGFEPTTLEPWCPGAIDITSQKWLMLAMDV